MPSHLNQCWPFGTNLSQIKYPNVLYKLATILFKPQLCYGCVYSPGDGTWSTLLCRVSRVRPGGVDVPLVDFLLLTRAAVLGVFATVLAAGRPVGVATLLATVVPGALAGVLPADAAVGFPAAADFPPVVAAILRARFFWARNYNSTGTWLTHWPLGDLNEILEKWL